MKQFHFKTVSILFTLLGCLTGFGGIAQCFKPDPLTSGQVKMMTGTWTGSYQSDGKEIPVTMVIRETKDQQITCNMDKPPVEGKTDFELFYFCPGGEFHMKKSVGEKTYTFQGTPINNVIKGYMKIQVNNKTIQDGQFSITRAETH